mmetsp:Transcript_1025/g.1311  ORF Transcript_1025/g.1311 Transcript_1025/m.1311 type:complete len:102 (-) Transcript_1025:439-744(-)
MGSLSSEKSLSDFIPSQADFFASEQQLSSLSPLLLISIVKEVFKLRFGYFKNKFLGGTKTLVLFFYLREHGFPNEIAKRKIISTRENNEKAEMNPTIQTQQ